MKKLNGDLEFGTRVKLLETSRWADGTKDNPVDVVGTVIGIDSLDDDWINVQWSDDITNAYRCGESDFEVIENVY